ncbi:NAD-dependent epimerase/dehydratase family protein [Actinoallomurus purpureus]|uniref:NAD-dependent epimerase/dehydratase family protein n=1 Tax=Actinoallomurus purpureus TaxID=478114 RepID=UPI002092567A|nr:NAD-dependent epimerase/dehydratase family protein [Actinoallomurus purpureus]MCO6005063.1 NAD-dependent epimerase/dehydratase family protein [Actinoallomurus purpureus]
MRLLVIGGSVFLGHAFVTRALRRGDRVTTFNRGRSGTDVPGAEVVRGDRENDDDLRRLVEGRRWDAVIDTCGYVPRVAGRSARALSGHADAYLFVSSVHAYADWPERRVDESSALHPCPPDAGPDDDVPYNTLKAGCERAVETGFDGRVLILNPGLITGPREQVPRLTWWLNRIASGGPVLAPGDPGRAMQLVDARDIAEFGLARLAAGATGRFLVSGVPGNTTFGALLDDCVRVTGSAAVPTWVDDAFLLERGVAEWTELPMWAPGGPTMAGVWLPSSDQALRAGLRCRPVADTVQDTWAWIRDENVAAGRAAEGGQGIDPEKERRILAAWTEGGSHGAR